MIGISVDSIYVHKVWNDEELVKLIEGGVRFPLASDIGGQIGRMYDIYDSETGVDVRGTFIVDPDGKIVGFEVLTGLIGRNIDETIRQVQAFQHVREVKGEVCPAGWRPGMPTLKPSRDLVGKVWTIWKPES